MVIIMNQTIQNMLDVWHKHYEDEEVQYSEFEHSDIEYFVGCMLYNTFAFSKALDTMKTIDPSYDFLTTCGEHYELFLEKMKRFEFENEEQKVAFLLEFIEDSQKKYSDDELYLLNRLHKHIKSLQERYERNIEPQKIVFEKPVTPFTRNPFGGF